MKRAVVLAYGLVNYAIFLGTFLYLAGFTGNLLVPKSMDSAPVGPLGIALAVNALLVGLFAAQHSVMARPTFKKWWTKFVPQPIERSTYVLFTNAALILLFYDTGARLSEIANIGMEDLDTTLHVLRFEGMEEVSRLFSFHLELASEEATNLRHNYIDNTSTSRRCARH